MKRTIIITLVAGLALVGLSLAGCSSGEQKQPGSAAKTEQKTTTQTQDPTRQAAPPYPINWCVVSGEELGKMGDAVTYNYKGRTVKFCCNGCVKTFEKQPEAYIAKLDSAAAGLVKSPKAGA